MSERAPSGYPTERLRAALQAAVDGAPHWREQARALLAEQHDAEAGAAEILHVKETDDA